MDYISLLLITILFILISAILYKKISKAKIAKKCFSYNLIDNNENLIKFKSTIESNIGNLKQIGIDIEYYRGEKYHGRICLIQMTLPNKETFILDLIKLDKSSYQDF